MKAGGINVTIFAFSAERMGELGIEDFGLRIGEGAQVSPDGIMCTFY